MTGDSLEIEYLCTLRGKRGQQTGFAATGETTDEPEAESLRMRCQRRNDVPAVRAIAAVELRRAPADFAQHVDERAAPLSAAPAIDERLPFPRLVACMSFDDARDIARDQCGTDLARIERRNPHVHRSNTRALVVAQHRPVHRARHVIFGKFGWRAHIDAVRERRDPIDGHFPIGSRRRSGWQRSIHDLWRSGTSDGQTFASIRDCAAAVG